MGIATQPWPWNPIGAGDIDGDSGKIISVTNSGSWIHIVTQPLQWACKNVACECTFEQNITLDGTGFWVTSTLHNARSDHTSYGPMGQELPATYGVGTLYRLFSYVGSEPWTNGPLTEFTNGK